MISLRRFLAALSAVLAGGALAQPAAAAFGLTLPATLLERADRILR
jgi:hypothetical protein